MTNDCRLPRRKGPTKKIDPGVTMTKQNEAAAADINNIVKRYRDTGTLQHVAQRQPYYADVSSVPTYQNAQNTIIEAQKSFETLPSRTRKKFKNEPLAMIEFLADPNNKEEAIKLGLIKPPEKETPPIKVEVTNKEEKK